MAIAPVPGASGYIPALYQWTGYYFGVGLGGGFGSATFTDPFNGQVASPSLAGFLVGAITGINYQIGPFVLGAEIDFTGSWSKGRVNDPAGDILQTSVFWTSSVTGRFGYAFDRLLVYGKGGAGFDYDRNLITQPSGLSVLGTVYRTGWTVGGGAEYAFTDHWIVRIEYDFFQFPVKSFGFGGPLGTSVTGAVGFNMNQLIGAVSYKF